MEEKKSIEQHEIAVILESAKRLGVELNESDAIQWLTAMSATQSEEMVVDERSGVFGHRVTMLDFSDEDLNHFRRIGKLIEFEDIPGKIETALALSGSAAQSKIQTYPGDADYFERVNIIADTREQACEILAELIRNKALSTMKGSNYELIEVKFGSYPFDSYREKVFNKCGSPISWSPNELKAGVFKVDKVDGSSADITWEGASLDPGWCKLDWVVADLNRKLLVNASNMLDVTWESPDGSIIPLDGYLDSFFQEVYLEAESIPIFTKLVKHVTGDALDNYVKALENEVRKYVTKNPNFGKAAKRLYNIFRLTGKYVEAAYIRELFDEPTTILYQVWTLIRTVEESFQKDSKIDKKTALDQADKLILAVVGTLEGEKETEIVQRLLRFRSLLVEDVDRGVLSVRAEAARAEVINIVNNFFYEKLTGVPEIHTYIEEIKSK